MSFSSSTAKQILKTTYIFQSQTAFTWIELAFTFDFFGFTVHDIINKLFSILLHMHKYFTKPKISYKRQLLKY